MSKVLESKIEWGIEHINTSGDRAVTLELDYYDLIKIKHLLDAEDHRRDQLIKLVKEQNRYRKQLYESEEKARGQSE